MSMDPIKTTEYINEKYKEYISSILSVKDERLKEKAFKKINKCIYKYFCFRKYNRLI